MKGISVSCSLGTMGSATPNSVQCFFILIDHFDHWACDCEEVLWSKRGKGQNQTEELLFNEQVNKD